MSGRKNQTIPFLLERFAHYDNVHAGKILRQRGPLAVDPLLLDVPHLACGDPEPLGNVLPRIHDARVVLDQGQEDRPSFLLWQSLAGVSCHGFLRHLDREGVEATARRRGQ